MRCGQVGLNVNVGKYKYLGDKLVFMMQNILKVIETIKEPSSKKAKS